MRVRFSASPYSEALHENFVRNAGRLLALEEARKGRLDFAEAYLRFDFAPNALELTHELEGIREGLSVGRATPVVKWRESPPMRHEFKGWEEFEEFVG